MASISHSIAVTPGHLGLQFISFTTVACRPLYVHKKLIASRNLFEYRISSCYYLQY